MLVRRCPQPPLPPPAGTAVWFLCDTPWDIPCNIPWDTVDGII